MKVRCVASYGSNQGGGAIGFKEGCVPVVQWRLPPNNCNARCRHIQLQFASISDVKAVAVMHSNLALQVAVCNAGNKHHIVGSEPVTATVYFAP